MPKTLSKKQNNVWPMDPTDLSDEERRELIGYAGPDPERRTIDQQAAQLIERRDNALAKGDQETARLMQKILLGTAYHEAGHAVAAVRLRRGFEYVALGPSPDMPDSCGHIRHTDLWTVSHYPGRYRFAAVVVLAGPIAEQRWDESMGEEILDWWDDLQNRLADSEPWPSLGPGFSPGRVRSPAERGDLAEAERLIHAVYHPFSDEELFFYLRALACKGRVWVTKWWPEVSVVAEELYRKRRLSRRQVGKLLQPFRPSQRDRTDS